MKMKEESEKVGLKLNIQKIRIMASGPITSWQIKAETMETTTDFISLGSKITTDCDCGQEIKRCLLLGRKAMSRQTAYQKAEILFCQQRSIQSKLWFFQYSFMGVRVGLQRKLNTEELMLLTVVLEKTLESPLDCKEIQQSILKEISPEYQY